MIIEFIYPKLVEDYLPEYKYIHIHTHTYTLQPCFLVDPRVLSRQQQCCVLYVSSHVE